MVMNFGAWDQGVAASKAEFKSKRAENAALYSNFLKDNPDASVDERSMFSGNLAGNSNFLKNALPTRGMMEKNVTRRQQQQAAAATARKQAALQNNIKMAGQLAGVYGQAYVAGGEEGAMSAVKDLAGDVLPEAALPLVQQFGRAKAQEIVNARMQPKFDNWKLAGASVSDIQTWSTGISEGAQDLLTPWMNQANSTVKALGAADYQKASVNATSIVNGGDETRVQNFVNPTNLKALYPHLSDRAADVISETNDKFKGFQTAKTLKIEAATKTSIEASSTGLRDGTIPSVRDAVAAIEAKGRLIDPTYKLGVEETSVLEESLRQGLQQQNNIKDMSENIGLALDAQKLTGPNQFIAGGNFEEIGKVAKAIEVIANGFVNEDEDNAPDAKALASQALMATEKFSESYGIPINDQFVWSALSKAALQSSKDLGQSPNKVSDTTMMAAAHNAMSSLQGPQGKAYKIALANLGVSTLNELHEVRESGKFAGAYAEAINTVAIAHEDVFEAGVYMPEHIEKKVKETVDTAKTLVTTLQQPGENGKSILQNAQATIDTAGTPESLPDIVNGVYDGETALREAGSKLFLQMEMLTDRKRRTELRLQATEFQTLDMKVGLESATASVDLINQQLIEAQKLYDQITVRRQQLGQKGLSAIKGNARPNVENVQAIAEMIWPMAMRSGSTPSEQIDAAIKLIKTSIPEEDLSSYNPRAGALMEAILDYVELGLDLKGNDADGNPIETTDKDWEQLLEKSIRDEGILKDRSEGQGSRYPQAVSSTDSSTEKPQTTSPSGTGMLKTITIEELKAAGFSGADLYNNALVLGYTEEELAAEGITPN